MSLTVVCVSPNSGNVTYSYMSIKKPVSNVTYSYMSITHQW